MSALEIVPLLALLEAEHGPVELGDGHETWLRARRCPRRHLRAKAIVATIVVDVGVGLELMRFISLRSRKPRCDAVRGSRSKVNGAAARPRRSTP